MTEVRYTELRLDGVRRRGRSAPAGGCARVARTAHRGVAACDGLRPSTRDRAAAGCCGVHRPCGRLAALAVALLLGGSLAACGGGDGEVGGEPSSAAAPKTVVVRTEVPGQRDVVDTATLSADLQPARRAVLAAEVDGVVERLAVDEGDRVRSGQLVAAIDTRALAQAVAEAQAVERQAQAGFERAQALYAKRAITKQQMLDAVTQRDVAASRLASARLALSKSRVTAPWAGVIAGKRVEVGDFVAPGQPVVELVDDRRLEARAPAPASDVPHLAVGLPVVVRVDALPGEDFPARITRLGTELDPQSRSLLVEAEIDNRGGRLRPGMPAVMEVPRRTLTDAVLVPLEAVVDLGEQRAVFVVEDGRARRRIVALGPVIGERVVIVSGVAAGEPVIVDGEQLVADGQPVREAAADATPAAGEIAR